MLYNSVTDAEMLLSMLNAINVFNGYTSAKYNNSLIFVEARILDSNNILDTILFRDTAFHIYIAELNKQYKNNIPDQILLNLVKTTINNITRNTKSPSKKLKKKLSLNQKLKIYIGSIGVAPYDQNITTFHNINAGGLNKRLDETAISINNMINDSIANSALGTHIIFEY